ncbi:MAG: tetratricopeptide repeat protein [bacterium]|nr:tetratricopeptide repeat protein [bacterium]
MDHFGKQPKFEIRPIIEQKPFESPAVRAFFKKWCEINDSIQPQIVTRSLWEQGGLGGFLEKRPDGKQTLCIPEDLQLWEMIGVMETVDHDTFATQPERRDEKKEELLALSRTFENAGVYIAKRLDSVHEGKEIARALAEEFYAYGQSLASGKKSREEVATGEIAEHKLSPEDVAEVDRFLAGGTLYASRRARAEKAAVGNPSQMDEFYEAERQKTLTQFFRASEKAFFLQQKTEDGGLSRSLQHLKPWQSDAPIHSAFLRKVTRAMEKQIEAPKRELVGSMFRRGMELLRKNMPFDLLPSSIKKSILHWQNGEETLREGLGIDQLKVELETVRQAGNVAAVGQKERKIADTIQRAVSSFPYKLDANNPSEIVANQCVNCVGASTLGGALLSGVGIKYLVGDVPRHSVLVVVASDGKIEWRDMLVAEDNEEITDEMIGGKTKDGRPLTVEDLAAYANSPKPEGLMFDIKDDMHRQKLPWVPEGQGHLAVFPPEIGQQMQVLNNAGGALYKLGRDKEAIEAYRQAVAVDPKSPYPYNGLGAALNELGRNKEAIEACRQAVAINPKYASPYYGLGSALNKLGRNKEAIEAYRQFISLADKAEDAYWIESAEKIISKLS